MCKFVNYMILLLCVSFFTLGCNSAKNKAKEAVLIKISEISVNFEINDDLSISWELPQEYNFTNKKNIFIQFEMIMMDNTNYGMFLTSFDNYSIFLTPAFIIEKLVFTYPKKPKCLHAIITKYNDDRTEKEQWFFNIDISNINVVITEEEMKPGIFTTFRGQWVPETITLEDGQLFKANAYYLITTYEQIHRKSKYKISHSAIFKINYETEMVNNKDGKLNLNTGALSLDRIRLRQILINGNNHDGFTLFVTPESQTFFKVEEGSVRMY